MHTVVGLGSMAETNPSISVLDGGCRSTRLTLQ